MTIRIYLFTLTLLSYSSAHSAPPLSPADLSFLKDVQTESFDYSISDTLINKISPHYVVSLGMSRTIKGNDLAYNLNQVLVGPATTVKRIGNEKYVITGCRAHSCPEQGWIWIDAHQMKAVAGIIHYVYGDSVTLPRLLVFSNHYTPRTLPGDAIQSMESWLAAWHKEHKLFIENFKPDFTDKDYSINEIRYIGVDRSLLMLCESAPCSPSAVFGSIEKSNSN